jgi:peptide/nickel transport system permease protein
VRRRASTGTVAQLRLWVYFARRLLLVVPVILGVVSITFVLVSTLPVTDRLVADFGTPPIRNPWIYDPTQPCPPPAEAQQCYNPTYYRYLAESGLNESIPVQWALYVGNVLTFHWGFVSNGSVVSFVYQQSADRPVAQVMTWFLPYSLELLALAILILLATALPLGRLAAAQRNQPADQAVRALSFAGFALPTYLLGSVILLLFVLTLGPTTGFISRAPWCPGGEPTFSEVFGSWPTSQCFGGVYPAWLTSGVATRPTGFPTADAFLNGAPWLGVDSILRLILPACVIAFAHLGLVLRYVRNSSLEVMNLEYVRTARAMGVGERSVARRHIGRNTMTTTVTVLAVSFATFFGWLPITELVFGINGVGLLLALAAQEPVDFAALTGATLILIFMVVTANLVADLIVAYLDPRVRLGETMSA